MQNEIFINKINVNQVRNISELEIPLDVSNRKHLILTGKNGSGKTTLLLELNQFLTHIFNGQFKDWEQRLKNLTIFQKQVLELEKSNNSQNLAQIANLKNHIKTTEDWFKSFGGVEISFSNTIDLNEKSFTGEFLIAYFDAKRTTSLQIPSGIQKVNLKEKYSPTEKANQAFLQYIVNLKAERSFARDDGDEKEVKRIEDWFSKFEKWLGDILDAPELTLIFDRKNYNFKIKVDNKEPYSLSELSDGHSAILSILTEIILRMEAKNISDYNMQGIVLIDEIETHLHVDLQKKILPFLNDFFPKIQFIITTHSPFVLSSIENSVVCDLQNRIITEDLSGYSYDTLIESYFSSNKYSDLLIDKIERFEELSKSQHENDREEFLKLKNYLSLLPKFLSDELQVKLQQIELSNLNKKEG